ncbi:MAG: nitroreductase family protein [Verrucomicrobiae bacterium]|nr:nitroreductase family protein [Verrucomicrobiae bacterium]
MTVEEAILSRRSIRRFQNRDIEPDKLHAVLEAGRIAPSASNRQEWRYIAVKDSTRRRQLAEAARQQFFVAEAPVVLVCCADTNEHIMTCGQKCYPIDLAISIDHMTLRAVELGLGTCWIGAFDENKVKNLLSIPAAIRVVNLLPIGYPAETPSPRSRLGMAQMTCEEIWRF